MPRLGLLIIVNSQRDEGDNVEWRTFGCSDFSIDAWNNRYACPPGKTPEDLMEQEGLMLF